MSKKLHCYDASVTTHFSKSNGLTITKVMISNQLTDALLMIVMLNQLNQNERANDTSDSVSLDNIYDTQTLMVIDRDISKNNLTGDESRTCGDEVKMVDRNSCNSKVNGKRYKR